MKEIFRFTQSRPSEILSKGELNSFGLYLYPSEDNSDYFNKIRNSDNSATLAYHIEAFVPEIIQFHSAIRKLTQWIEEQAKPIKFSELDKEIKDNLNEILLDESAFDLTEIWEHLADSYITLLLMSNPIIQQELIIKETVTATLRKWLIEYEHLSLNNEEVYIKIFELFFSEVNILNFIRCCHIIRLYKEIESGDSQLGKVLNSETVDKYNLLDDLLESDIVIPPGLRHLRNFKKIQLANRDTPVYASKFHSLNPKTFNLHYLLPHTTNQNDCDCNETTPEPYCMQFETYVDDLFVIKEELLRYEEGDIAHIENVLAGENKTRKHIVTESREDFIEEESKSDIYDERDTQTSDKFSLQSQINKTIQESLNLNAGVTATQNGPSYSVSANANVAAAFSKSKAENVARSFAKDVVEKAVSKVQENFRKLESTRIKKELKEKNTHVLNNTKEGATHRSGIYYWVNKITKAQVFNHGKHMMFDFYVPEPAAIYKYLSNEQPKPPKSPKPEVPSINLSNITKNNYLDLVKRYGLSEVELPPEESLNLTFSLEHSVFKTHEMHSFSKESSGYQIPKGYYASEINYNGLRLHEEKHNFQPHLISIVSIANEIVHEDNFSDRQGEFKKEIVGTIPGNFEGEIPIKISGYTNKGFSIIVSIDITCKLKETELDEWKLSIFNLIMDDYRDRLQDWEDEQEPEDVSYIQIKGRNPFLNREVETEELKRHIIAALLCNYFTGIGSMRNGIIEKDDEGNIVKCQYPQIDFEHLEKDTPIIRFFEQVFLWKNMNYLFYHSMWSRKCKWKEMHEADSGDPLFDKFLTAGAARVQVPIRNGLEEEFKWFLQWGQIWQHGKPPVFGDPEYVSILQELKEAKQGDYNSRMGIIKKHETGDDKQVLLSETKYYWDFKNYKVNKLNLKNDINREILINREIYRIIDIQQFKEDNPLEWIITLNRNFEGKNDIYQHAVGALFVGAPWEINMPTKLVYLKNEEDKLPNY